MSSERRTWVVDAIEDDIAVIEEDGELVGHVPRWLLPADAGEGTILRVERRLSDDGSSRLIIAIDADATNRARGEPRVRPRNPADRGGDIVL